MLLRIIDKVSGLFLRDDFTFDEETEIGLDVSPDNKHSYTQRKWDVQAKHWVDATGTPV